MKILNCMLWWNAVDNAFGGWVWPKFHHSSLRSSWWNIDQTQPPHALSRASHHSILFNIPSISPRPHVTTNKHCFFFQLIKHDKRCKKKIVNLLLTVPSSWTGLTFLHSFQSCLIVICARYTLLPIQASAYNKPVRKIWPTLFTSVFSTSQISFRFTQMMKSSTLWELAYMCNKTFKRYSFYILFTR